MPVIKYLPACVDGKASSVGIEHMGDGKYRTESGDYLGLLQVPWICWIEPTPEAAIEAARRLWGCE